MRQEISIKGKNLLQGWLRRRVQGTYIDLRDLSFEDCITLLYASAAPTPAKSFTHDSFATYIYV